MQTDCLGSLLTGTHSSTSPASDGSPLHFDRDSRPLISKRGGEQEEPTIAGTPAPLLSCERVLMREWAKSCCSCRHGMAHSEAVLSSTAPEQNFPCPSGMSAATAASSHAAGAAASTNVSVAPTSSDERARLWHERVSVRDAQQVLVSTLRSQLELEQKRLAQLEIECAQLHTVAETGPLLESLSHELRAHLQRFLTTVDATLVGWPRNAALLLKDCSGLGAGGSIMRRSPPAHSAFSPGSLCCLCGLGASAIAVLGIP